MRLSCSGLQGARAPWFRRNEIAAGLQGKPGPAAAGHAAALPAMLPGNAAECFYSMAIA
ncbi:conserved protein of unknown function [Paraburkholderia dioscoreae]|uniref:Uncharacterized protein n=1 Tax=Paraburkholderia dioscoreae TaxID=2604047 RepID=A0A5Q4ZE46_9BURK|nr:conserved protein of unknown function [Paraburkholderia dioscoreae]